MKVSAPGRICLFGEHQDYLGLPVIACAISLRISIAGQHEASNAITVELPDIGARECFSTLESRHEYQSGEDYLRSGYNLLCQRGFTFSRGIRCSVSGTIPINAGTSSSSALVVAWIQFLAAMSDQGSLLPPSEVARLAYLAEVEEFGQHGGMMDQYSSALGGVIHLSPPRDVTLLDMDPGSIVLADSMEPKNTQGVLGSARSRAEAVLKKIPGISLNSAASQIESLRSQFTPVEYDLLKSILRNRDITVDALSAGSSRRTGKLLLEEHGILRDSLGVSTVKIDRMVQAAVDAGAYGAKINGSGGGGCMFATAPSRDVARVMAALEPLDCRVWHVKPDRGVSVED